MQFQAVLSNQHHPESGVVTVTFPIPRAEYDNTIALLGPLEIGDAVRRDCRIDEVSGGFPVLKQLERNQCKPRRTGLPRQAAGQLRRL